MQHPAGATDRRRQVAQRCFALRGPQQQDKWGMPATGLVGILPTILMIAQGSAYSAQRYL